MINKSSLKSKSMKFITTIYDQYDHVYGYQLRMNYSGLDEPGYISQYFSVRQYGDDVSAKKEAIRKRAQAFKIINKQLLRLTP